MKKPILFVLALAVALVVLIATILASASQTRYTDVTSEHWAYDAIEAMSRRGIIAGYPDGSFQPSETVTYGEFIKMAVVAGTGKDVGAAGGDAGNPSRESGSHWARAYYDAAVSAGYFTVHHIPNDELPWEIPRGDMALIAAAIIGEEEPVRNYDEIAAQITDVTHRTKHEYAIIRAYREGILTGYPDNTFRPEGTLTRAEAAAVIDRLVARTGGGPAPAAEEPERPLTTLERLAEYSYDLEDGQVLRHFDYVNWVATSVSTLPISDVIDDFSAFHDDPERFEHLKYYEVVTDYPYPVTTNRNLVGTEFIKIEGPEIVSIPYLIKDKKVIGLGVSSSTYIRFPGTEPGSGFPMDFDYIGFYMGGYYEELDRVADIMLLLPNSFR